MRELPRALDGKPGRLPSCQASLKVEHLLVAPIKKCGLTLSSARPDHAIQGDAVGRVDLGDALRHLVERGVDCAAAVA